MYLLQNNRTCFDSNKPIPDFVARYEQLKLIESTAIADLSQLASHMSSTSVLKCWRNNEEVNCNETFVDLPDTLGRCFTFNYNRNLIIGTSKIATSKPLPNPGSSNDNKFISIFQTSQKQKV